MGSAVSTVPQAFNSMKVDDQAAYKAKFDELVKAGKDPAEAIKELEAEVRATQDAENTLQTADADGDGAVTEKELVAAGVAAGKSPVQAEKAARQTLATADTDGDGKVTKEELVVAGTKKWLDAFNQKLLKAFFSEYDAVKAAFAAADVNGGGTLSAQEFGKLMRETGGLDVSDDEVAAAFSIADKDGDGVVNWVEFVKVLESDQGVPPPPGPAPDPKMLAEDRKQNISRGPAGIAGLLRQHLSRKYRDLRKAFLDADPNRSGFIDAKEVQEMLAKMNLGVSMEDLTMFVGAYKHENGDGFSYPEFVKMIEGAKPYKAMDIAEE